MNRREAKQRALRWAAADLFSHCLNCSRAARIASDVGLGDEPTIDDKKCLAALRELVCELWRRGDGDLDAAWYRKAKRDGGG